TLRLDGDRRTVAAGGVVDQVRDRAGTDRGRTSGAERAARAHASHAEAGGGDAAGRKSARATASAGRLPPGIQRSAAARSAGDADSGECIRAVGACLSSESTGAGVSLDDAGAQRAVAWTFSLAEAARRISERGVVGRARGPVA